jgi:hypothetical protein
MGRRISSFLDLTLMGFRSSTWGEMGAGGTLEVGSELGLIDVTYGAVPGPVDGMSLEVGTAYVA